MVIYFGDLFGAQACVCAQTYVYRCGNFWYYCRIRDTEAKYYADGEDAFDMKKMLKE